MKLFLLLLQRKEKKTKHLNILCTAKKVWSNSFAGIKDYFLSFDCQLIHFELCGTYVEKLFIILRTCLCIQIYMNIVNKNFIISIGIFRCSLSFSSSLLLYPIAHFFFLFFKIMLKSYDYIFLSFRSLK